jgi:predicted secreted hydrolase
MPTPTVTLPADDAFLIQHPTQWWYWTGHVFTPDGRKFGFELCWFAFHADVLLGKWIGSHLGKEGLIDRLTNYAGLQMVNVALTDVAGQQYLSHSYFSLGHPTAVTDGFDLASHWPHRGAVTAVGGNGRDTLHVAAPSYGLDLRLRNDDAAHPPVLQYRGAMHEYSFGGYTYYYSRPLMQASGTVSLDGAEIAVNGTAWFDRQYGELNQAVIAGWQWFALQLDDDRQVMVFAFTNQPSERYASIAQGRSVINPAADQIEVEPLAHWTSPTTGVVYPAAWQVTVGGETFVVRPTVADQEMREPAPWPAYWEGDSIVFDPSGRQIGLAYVELSGFKKPAAPEA